ncbi:MAG: hypothetical protein L6N94_06810 [Candidatus Methylarchaceae archaeon HK01M]|nr:hypothetical protein [Candidatus Methylarchaceae archaeon HK01M]
MEYSIMKLLKMVGVLCTSLLLFAMVPLVEVSLGEATESTKAETEIDLNMSSYLLEVGSSLEVNGCITDSSSGELCPSHNVNVTLTYITPYGETIPCTLLTSSGEFHHTFSPTVIGRWEVTASWDGDKDYEGATTRIGVKVTQQTWIVMILFFAIGIIFVLITLFIARPYAKSRFRFRPKDK